MQFQYFSEIRRLLDEVETKESESMEKAVAALTKAVLGKRAIYVFGASHAGILTQEMFYRAGGLVVINPIFGSEVMLDTSPITHTSKMERLVGYGTLLAQKTPMQEGDVLIVHSVSGRNPVTIEVAMEAKKRNAIVICITNLTYSKSVTSRHPSGKNLYEVSDIVIDNHGEKGDACVAVKGIEQKVSPTSTVIGASILNSIVAATAQALVDAGLKTPPIFYSANVDGGDELNRKIYEEYKENIHYSY
ncbi:SIS domain-containing protein [Caproiciproducens galactitolivorans]|uniref:SIS domain-containing protein n=1 Tax=Caproiciproducens galactitolivorans TaxID=642589 RepID=A0ABT4BX07_9FIRM|nr:SIS domain-containing protein [Caproiciproducens galactitolivorans]MCY1714478.1 SIS domain-containing protein [Caproiciproducens galactitolivorans]